MGSATAHVAVRSSAPIASAVLAGGGVPVRIIDSPFGPESPGDEREADPDEIYGVFLDDSMTEVRAL